MLSIRSLHINAVAGVGDRDVSALLNRSLCRKDAEVIWLIIIEAIVVIVMAE